MEKGKIVVFGSFAADLTSRASRLPRQGETVIGESFSSGPGGKGSNQAVAAHRAGGDTTMVTKIGKDMFGEMALDFYGKEGMNTEYVFMDETNKTGTALIMVDENTAENQILVVPGASGNITDGDIRKVEEVIVEADILLLQLEINLDAIEKILELAKKHGVLTVLNTAPVIELPEKIFSKVSIITPNEHEAECLTGIKVDCPENAEKAADQLIARGVQTVLITMGKDGVYVKSGSRAEMINSIEVEAVDTTGAGDAFNGGFVTALSEGKDVFQAAKFANIVGALSVTKVGTAPAMPYRDAIDSIITKEV